jgi:polyketide cyclase/dehydrase/lipid transport protein
MAARSLEVTGPLAPAAVWERYAVPAHWPDWLPQIDRVDLSTPRLAAGATGRLHAPMGISIPFAVDAVDDAARRWSWSIRVGLLRLRLEQWVDDGPDGGTTAGMRVSGPGPLVAGYAGQATAALERLVGASG